MEREFDESFGRGLEAALEIQRRVNETHNLLAEHLKNSSTFSERDPISAIRKLAESESGRAVAVVDWKD